MQYIKKGEINNLVLNINNNARPDFSTYSLVFIHVMSKQEKTYTISTSNPTQFTSNIRYCTVTLDLITDDLIYEGQYTLNVYGNGVELVYVTMAVAEGIAESKPFTEYVSPNEVNENYIYIQEDNVPPTPSVTPTNTVTPTPSITPTNTVTPTPSVTPTNTVTPTPSITPTNTITPTPSITPTNTVTPTPTITPTNTLTPTPTVTPSSTPPAPELPSTILVNGTSYPGSGNIWYSLSIGTTYDGTLYNSPTFYTSNGGYFDFNGIDQYVDFGDASAGDSTSDRSFGGWFKMDNPNVGSDNVFTYRGLDGTGAGWSIAVYKNGADNKIGVYAIGGGGVLSTTALVAGQWYYIIASWTQSAMKIWINGNLEGTNSAVGSVLRGPSKGWTIGKGHYDTFWAVQSGRFELYDYVLTNSQVLSNYNRTKSNYGY